MAAGEQRPWADFHLKIHGFAEKYLLIHSSLPHVAARRPRLGQFHVFRPHRDCHVFVNAQLPVGLHLQLADFSPYADAVRRVHDADDAIDEVGVADEVGNELAGRTLVDVARCADLKNPSLAHHRDLPRQRERFALVVSHVDRGDFGPLQPLQFETHPLAQLCIQIRERLVEQEQCRLHHQRACERQALLLPSGELRRLALGQFAKLHGVEHAHDAVADVRARGEGPPRTCKGNAAFSKTVMCGQMAYD